MHCRIIECHLCRGNRAAYAASAVEGNGSRHKLADFIHKTSELPLSMDLDNSAFDSLVHFGSIFHFSLHIFLCH